MFSKKPAGESLPVSTVLSYALGYGSGNQFISALTGMAFVRFIVPVITAVIVILCLRVYPVNESVKEQMKNLYRNKEVTP